MIIKTDIQVDIDALRNDYRKNIDDWPIYGNKICLNNYNGNDDYEKNANIRLVYTEFRYMNSCFKNTIWEETLNLLPGKIGRARLMLMQPGAVLTRHRDIDARWQLALFTDPRCILYDVEEDQEYHIPADGYFYRLDARRVHSAHNNTDNLVRVNLVVTEYV